MLEKLHLNFLYVKGEAFPMASIIWKWKFLLHFQCRMCRRWFHTYSNVNISSNKIYIMDKSYSYLKCLKIFWLKRQHHKINFYFQSIQRNKFHSFLRMKVVMTLDSQEVGKFELQVWYWYVFFLFIFLFFSFFTKSGNHCSWKPIHLRTG